MLPTLANPSKKPFRNAARPSVGESLPQVRSQPFERFGCWAPSVTVARDGTIGRLARWLALNQYAAAVPSPDYLQTSSRGEAGRLLARKASVSTGSVLKYAEDRNAKPDDDQQSTCATAADGLRIIRANADHLWQRCQEANPECFRTYRVVTLDRPSYFLPAGEVVFEVLENPTQIPERPPTGVMLRHLEAMDAFPSATFYFLRPVFVTEPAFRLCTAGELRSEAHFDRLDALRLARHFGWWFRTQAFLAAKRDAAALFAFRGLVRAVEALTWHLAPLPAGTRIDPRTRRRYRQEFLRRLERTQSLGLAAESRRLEFALAELRRRLATDPVLAFELPDRTGELWFEAHWFIGQGGRTYVHY